MAYRSERTSMSGNAEKDFLALNRVNEMCQESLHPSIYDMWIIVKHELVARRKSLIHIHRASKDDTDTCDICGGNLRNEIHKRS